MQERTSWGKRTRGGKKEREREAPCRKHELWLLDLHTLRHDPVSTQWTPWIGCSVEDHQREICAQRTNTRNKQSTAQHSKAQKISPPPWVSQEKGEWRRKKRQELSPLPDMLLLDERSNFWPLSRGEPLFFFLAQLLKFNSSGNIFSFRWDLLGPLCLLLRRNESKSDSKMNKEMKNKKEPSNPPCGHHLCHWCLLSPPVLKALPFFERCESERMNWELGTWTSIPQFLP